MGTNGVAPHDALAALDLGYPGLEAVLRALDAGDRAAAQAAYLAHYRQRRQPVLHWHFGGDGDFAAR
ncbi:MAG: heparinase II/III family protein, partial [Candidatus Latescibacteria bacterium]|nr:heparinase II/III family protein [Candidatus Latescibacterota bacterium]